MLSLIRCMGHFTSSRDDKRVGMLIFMALNNSEQFEMSLAEIIYSVLRAVFLFVNRLYITD